MTASAKLVELLNDEADGYGRGPIVIHDVHAMQSLLRQAAAALEEAQSSRDGYIAQHQADSAELRRLCAARDEAIAARQSAESELAALRERVATLAGALDAVMIEGTMGEGYASKPCPHMVESIAAIISMMRVALVPIDAAGDGND